MGLAYRSDGVTGLTVTVIDGLVTAPEFHELAQRQDADPDWHRTTRLLTDARTAVSAPITGEQVESLAALYAQMRVSDQPFRNAIVAGPDFATAERYGELRSVSGSRTIVFSDLATACTWLGADLGVVQSTITELRGGLRAIP
jgi:hypothetical protein